MTSKFNASPSDTDYVDGVSRTYYQDQVIHSSGALDDQFEFKMAAAHAKDQARHKMIRAISEKAREYRLNQGRFQEVGSFFNGDRLNENEIRTVDGVAGAPDEAIKL